MTSHLVFALLYFLAISANCPSAEGVCTACVFYKLTWRSLSGALLHSRARTMAEFGKTEARKTKLDRGQLELPWASCSLEPCTPAETAVNPTCCTIEQTEPHAPISFSTLGELRCTGTFCCSPRGKRIFAARDPRNLFFFRFISSVGKFAGSSSSG